MIAPAKYASLPGGQLLTFEIVVARGGKTHTVRREGRLLYAFTKWRESRDDKGKVTSRELVGDRLGVAYDDRWVTRDGERLQVYETHVCCGLFRILGVAGGG